MLLSTIIREKFLLSFVVLPSVSKYCKQKLTPYREVRGLFSNEIPDSETIYHVQKES